MTTDQLAQDEPRPDLVRRRKAWKDDYPWLDQAFREAGPSARAASEGWRVRVEDELKTTLDFKVRPDGTAAVWCGMSGYEFHHDPTTKELFEGLTEAYRRELKRRRQQPPHPQAQTGDERRRAAGGPRPQSSPVLALPPSGEEALTRIMAGVLLHYVDQLMLICLAVTALTLVLSAVAIAVG